LCAFSVSGLLWAFAARKFAGLLFLLAPPEQHHREKAGEDERDGKLDEGGGVRL
jgi:hypothetical protein